jgi:hypothetical protein
MNYKISDVIEFIEKLELIYNLYDKKINDIYFWKIIRYDIYMLITKGVGVLDESQPNDINNSLSIIEKLKKDFTLIKYNALKGSYLKDILIFQSSRKTKVNGKDIDIYTHYLASELETLSMVSYDLLESTFFGIDYHKQNTSKLALRTSLKSKLIRMFKVTRFNFGDIQLLKEIKYEILREFNIDLDIFTLVKQAIEKFKFDYKYYNKLVRKRKPKSIYLVCSYGLEALISAAKSNGVEVIEIQHGTMSKFHIGYSFPSKAKVPYFPDKILLFGKYWSDATPLPLPNSKRILCGYPYLEKQIEKDKNVVKNNKSNMIFLSQPTISNRLSKVAFDFAKNNEQYNVFYKLHPSEFKVWKKNYEFLVKGNDLQNFIVIDNNNKNLYELFTEVEIQVGVYSTAIFEGIAMGLRTILVDLPGIEYMEYLIEKEMVTKVNDADELALCIKEDPLLNYDKNYFFKDIKDTCYFK